MRINKYVAQATGMSRRAADGAIAEGRVLLNGTVPSSGYDVQDGDHVTLDKRTITPDVKPLTLMMNKPAGYVVSRNGQGSPTIYSLLPLQYHKLKPVGRLDKDSSGLLLLTNDGTLANRLTHPSYQKTKIYEVTLNKPLQPLHQQMITDHGIQLEDGRSQFLVTKIGSAPRAGGERSEPGEDRAGGERSDAATRGGASPSSDNENSSPLSTNATPHYQITMHEGRNRQIRRTFTALGYQVTKLHRTHFGPYNLNNFPATKVFEILS